MTETERNNEEGAGGAGSNTQRPDSKALCESLVLKLTEKNDDKSNPNLKKPYRSEKQKSEEMSDTDESEKDDEDSDC
ncbi:unnamed protein product [Euphydryas editha]|uniref:Uncharacterized protein n=1 Tax=Euphydryas editha TaxID=104508 RepID=A0AAU9UVH8_EUPED|nr:unnamed protein product [Euphydryas editha]